MHKLILLLAVVLACAPGTLGCAHTYTHDEGLRPIHGRRLMAGGSCGYNHSAAGRDWPAYDAECSWSCSGETQSPINVPTSGNLVLKKDLLAGLKFGTASDISVLNIGHAVQVEWSKLSGSKASVVVQGDSVFNMYEAENPNKFPARRINVQPLQFHFHGTSEHLVKGRSSMLEFHLVTKLVPTKGVKMPKECPEGSDKLCLAVFGVMYDLDYTNQDTSGGDPTIQKIIDALPKCEEAGKECATKVKGWKLDLGAILPNTEYYTYTGSLTTPPCSQGVMWHVFPTVKATLSEAQAIDLQLALSTAVMGGEVMDNRLNNRVTLPLNGRSVYASS